MSFVLLSRRQLSEILRRKCGHTLVRMCATFNAGTRSTGIAPDKATKAARPMMGNGITDEGGMCPECTDVSAEMGTDPGADPRRDSRADPDTDLGPNPSAAEGRAIVLVGMMGAGKSCIGRRLAEAWHLPFYDSDSEVEAAAALSIEDIFQCYGETAFRDCERRVVSRLLEGGRCVIATGGGAFMDPETRALVRQNGLSVWLRADLDLLLRRVMRRNNRPILKRGDPRQILSDLIEKRYPIYAEAEITVDSADIPADAMTRRVMAAIEAHRGADRLEKRTH